MAYLAKYYNDLFLINHCNVKPLTTLYLKKEITSLVKPRHIILLSREAKPLYPWTSPSHGKDMDKYNKERKDYGKL